MIGTVSSKTLICVTLPCANLKTIAYKLSKETPADFTRPFFKHDHGYKVALSDEFARLELVILDGLVQTSKVLG